MIWGSEIRLWFFCFLCKTLPKRLKFNKVDIYMLKVGHQKNTRTWCEICSKLTIKAPNQERYSRNIQTVYRRTSIQKCDFKFIEITLLHVYSSRNMLHICSRTPFLETIYGELLLYIVLNIDVRKSKYGSKYVDKKLFEVHFKIITKFYNFIRDFRLVAKYQLSEAVVIVD